MKYVVSADLKDVTDGKSIHGPETRSEVTDMIVEEVEKAALGAVQNIVLITDKEVHPLYITIKVDFTKEEGDDNEGDV